MKKFSRVLLAFSVFGCLPFVSSAQSALADEAKPVVYEVNVGLLHHDTADLWSGFNRESGIDINAEVLFNSFYEILGGTIHPALGVSVNTAGDTSKAYGGLRYRYELENGLFFGIGLGAAVHNGESRLVRSDKKALGSTLLFHIPAEVGYHFNKHYTVAAYFDHISNGYTQDENEGLDTIGLRFGYRF